MDIKGCGIKYLPAAGAGAHMDVNDSVLTQVWIESNCMLSRV